MRKTLMLAALAAITLGACTDTTISNLRSYGDSRQVTCYSGGVVIYQGRSTGMVEVASSGVQFKDQNGEFIEVLADCVLKTDFKS